VERDKPKKSESVGQTLPQLPWKQKRGGFKKNWIPFIKICRNIHRSVWQLLGLKEFKMAAVTMVTMVQNGRQLQKSSDLGEIWFPSRL
jgi:hypothetical protein